MYDSPQHWRALHIIIMHWNSNMMYISNTFIILQYIIIVLNNLEEGEEEEE